MSSAILITNDVSPLAGTGCTRAWLLRTAAWRGQWPWLRELVQPSQWRRHAGIRDAARRRDRLMAAALHRWIVAEALGFEPLQLPLYSADAGQPRLALPGMATSLSHTDGYIAIALSDGGPVGIDAERRDVPSLRPIADLVCSVAERRLPCDDEGLLHLWVRKEAALKAAGLGLSHPMSAFQAEEGGRVYLRDLQGAPISVSVNTLKGTGDCVVAVAGPVGRTPQWTWRQP